MNLLEQIQQAVYHKEITRKEIDIAITKAEDDIQKDIEAKCEHNWLWSGNDYGYFYCSKCKKLQ